MQPGFESPYPRETSEQWERFQLLVKTFPYTVAPIWVSLGIAVLSFVAPIPEQFQIVFDIFSSLILIFLFVILAWKMAAVYKKPAWLIIGIAIIVIFIPLGALAYAAFSQITVKQQLLRFKVRPTFFYVTKGDQETVRERLKKAGEKWAPATTAAL